VVDHFIISKGWFRLDLCENRHDGVEDTNFLLYRVFLDGRLVGIFLGITH